MVAARWFAAADRTAIARAVAVAERGTAAEIVPVVATCSDGYERAEDLVGLAFAALAFSLAWVFGQRLVPAAEWGVEHDLALSLPVLLLVLLAGFLVGVAAARWLPALKRLALSRRVARARVLVAAQQAFEALHVRRTAAATGVVLYVSMFEREVCVLADRAVARLVDPGEWERTCALLIAALRRGAPADGFVAAIEHCGAVLARHLPAAPGDRDELSNELHVLD